MNVGLHFKNAKVLGLFYLDRIFVEGRYLLMISWTQFLDKIVFGSLLLKKLGTKN